VARLLDTTVLIDVLRGRPAGERLRALRRGATVPAVCAVNVEELARGIRPGEEDTVAGLLDGLVVVRLGRSEGERAGRWRKEFARRGTTLSQADCLIAAAAVTAGVPLATGNPKRFPMPGIEVEHWPVGV
jgi:predicted nucleic acid-binding protein